MKAALALAAIVLGGVVLPASAANPSVWTAQKVSASDGAAGDQFGATVAVDGATAVIAATATGNDNLDLGAAYVVTQANGTWTPTAELIAGDEGPFDDFGASVALSGNTLVVGAPDAQGGLGAVYVFTEDNGTWTQSQELAAADATPDDGFGASVALDGATVIVGAPYAAGAVGEGAAYVFTESNGSWSQAQKLGAADGGANDEFGNSVVLRGTTAVVGAWLAGVNGHSQQGAAYVFSEANGTWSQAQKLTAADGASGDLFGTSLAFNRNGVLIGASGATVGGNGSQGAAYRFTEAGGAWAQAQKFTAADGVAGDEFGASVALAGDTALIGAPTVTGVGAAYLFSLSNGGAQPYKFIAGDGAAGDGYGSAVAFFGSSALVGAPNATVNGAQGQGAAYFYGKGGFHLTVNSVADSVDANPGDGICMDANGKCTLRAAVMEANALVGPDVIDFSSAIDGTPIRLTLHGAGEDADATGDLDILDDLSIAGNGTALTIVDGDAADRVFDVNPSSTQVAIDVNIDGLTARNGGGVSSGGGIRMQAATLTLSNVFVRNNSVQDTSSAHGGGISVENSPTTPTVTADLALDAAGVVYNTATSNGSAWGGGIAVGYDDQSEIDNSLIADNSVQGGTDQSINGGGLSLTNASLAMDTSVVRDNQATDTGGTQSVSLGGGISMTASKYAITNSGISGNAANASYFASGGGIDAEGASAGSAIADTTIADNTATARDDIGSAYGGGISLWQTPAGLVEELDNATVASNSIDAADTSGGGILVGDNAGSVITKNTLVAGNHLLAGAEQDCGTPGGTLTSGGYNLIGDASGCTFTNGSGDQVGTAGSPIDPKLGALTDNGGYARTLALLVGSPAVDAGNPAGCTDADGNPLTTDQRGEPRPTDGNADGVAVCDIGAYERAADRAPVASDGTLSTNENASADGTLNATDPDGDALVFAVASPPSHGTVAITDAAHGTFTYTPDNGYSGTDSFTFTANDGFADSNAATESVAVEGSGGGGSLGAATLIGLLPFAFAIRRGRRRNRSGVEAGE